MERIAIVTDSNSGISQEDAKKYEIRVLPMIFSVGNEEYREGISLTEEQFFASLERGEEVSTSQPSVLDLTELWEELLQTYDKIIHIPMSKVLSGGYQTSLALCQEYRGRVLVVDSRRISVTQTSMAIHARKLAQAGVSAEEIKEQLETIALDGAIYITVDSLKWLKKGGRISGVEATAGDILNIKPVIQIKGGMLEVHSKVRGHKKAKKAMEEILLEDWKRLRQSYSAEQLHLGIAHARAEEEALEWKEKLEELFPGKHVHLAKLPLNICCHVGPGTIGCGVFAD